MKPPRLLIIEDDLALVDLVAREVSDDFTVEVVETGTKGILAIERSEPDLVLLDMGLPEVHGLTILEHLESRCPRTRVCVMTVLSDLASKEAAFESGSDDYLVKPFDLRELKLRLTALMRRDKRVNRHALVFGDLCIFRGAPVAQIGGKRVQLPPIEHRLLVYLAERPGEVVSRGVLLDEVWLGADRFPNTVDAHIENLRKHIDAPFKAKRIRTAYRQGYFFEA